METKKGRPPKKAADRKSRYLQVRIVDQEKAAFDSAAKLAGLDTSAWVRERLRMAARAELQAVGQKVPFISGKKSTT